MKPTTFLWGLALAASGCLYTGDGTAGLPCNTDSECGGTQRCIERVCGGPTIATDGTSSASDASSEGSSDGEPADDDGDDDDDVRTECLASETQCLDGDLLRLCTDGKLETRACDGWCGQASEHNGCGTNPAGVDECYCLNPKSECSDEGAMRCDGNNIVQCSGGYEWPFDCDTICLDGGFVGVDSCGIGDSGEPTCFCSASACTHGAMRCLDNGTAQDCVDGAWQAAYECASASCPEGTYSRGCTYFAGDTAGCGCWEY
jgi:hypothetical protein